MDFFANETPVKYINVSGRTDLIFYNLFILQVKTFFADALQSLRLDPNLRYVIIFETSYPLLQETLYFRNNNLMNLNIEFHTNLFQNLAFLDLSGNNLEFISRTCFVNLTSLNTLVLANNLLNIMNKQHVHEFEQLFSHIAHLKHIDMSYNQLTSIPSTIFNNNTYLEYVLLFGNKLSSFSCFSNISPYLVDLHDNLISYFDQNAILIFQKIFERKRNTTFILNLNGNVFECSCHTTEFAQWILESKFIKKDSPILCVSKGKHIYMNTSSLSMIKEECNKRGPGFYISIAGIAITCLSTSGFVVCVTYIRKRRNLNRI